MNGPFRTDKTGIVTFLLSEINFKKQIPWKFHVDGGSKPSDTYGMIIARDFFGKLVITLNFNNKTVTCDIDTSLVKTSMKEHHPHSKYSKELYLGSHQSKLDRPGI
jgi:hypothetical protein